MVAKKLKSADFNQLDTREKILEVAINLFALKGFDGTTIREIAELADVNVASLNYHFTSKENLRLEIQSFIVNEFREKILSIPETTNVADYAVKIFETMTQESAKCLNQFKLFLESDNYPVESDPYPLGYERFRGFLEKELHSNVPQSERLWFMSVVLSYIIHNAVLSSTAYGRKTIGKYFSTKSLSLPVSIRHLVEALVRDLNCRYASV